MFKRFTQEEHVSSNSAVKSSVQRTIRAKILESYPHAHTMIDEVLPKKGANITIAKCSNHLSLICKDNVIMFFQERDGPIFPTLRLLHQYPYLMTKMQVDKGAIRFVMNGSHIMCPGFTSPGGAMEEPVEAGAPVAVMAEGKGHALAVGTTMLSREDIREKNNGVAVESIHYLGDGLWDLQELD
ncbi:unnamed protein product [Chrysoparadoxa australica]